MGLERDIHDVSKQSTNSSHEPSDQDRSESTPLYGNTVDSGTLKLIIAFFFGFSITVTIALAIQLSYGPTQIQLHGAVVSDDERCSHVGAEILKQGGNAVDAAIAVAFCMGVVNPHITGLGSGGLMLIYNQQERKLVDSIDFRVSRYNNDSIAGIPGFVAGMALAHKLYGSISWKNLLAPSEHIAREGFHVTPTLKNSEGFLANVTHNYELRSALENIKIDELIHNPALADTISTLSISDPYEFYKNKSMLASDLWHVGDISKITDYKAVQSPGVKASFLHYNIIVPGKGSGGPLLIENLKSVNLSLSPLVSTIKAFNATARNWPVSVASHVAVMDVNDMYVSLVSGLGSVLGSQFLTKSGYIMNNMAWITQDLRNERPDMLLAPVFAFENEKVCGRRLLLGAGDVRDIAQALVYLLRHPSSDILDSVEAPRVRIQTPIIELEQNSISEEDFSTLRAMNFALSYDHSLPPVYPSINIIQKINDTLTAHADSRGLGNYVIF